MSRKNINAVIAICLLIGATFAALANVAEINPPQSNAGTIPPNTPLSGDPLSGPLTLQAILCKA